MKKINVIDLDKTLIPFDSFRFYVFYKIRNGNLKVLFLTLLRKLRISSAESYKKNILSVTKLHSCEKDIDTIVKKIIDSINLNILSRIKENSADGTINILCSASPDIYVKKIAAYYNWEGFGSYFFEDEFYHMWGENKIKFIKKNILRRSTFIILQFLIVKVI